MTTKETFQPDEWQKLCELPHLVGLAVAGASLSGITGVLAEASSVAKTLANHKNSAQGLLLSWLNDATSNETAKRLLASTQQDQSSTPADRASEALRQSLFVLSAKATPEENNAIKNVLLEVAQNVAAAAKEGGFAGFGGEQINDAERAALEGIKTALGM